MKRPPFSLVKDGISTETTEALEQMLELARRGELIGLAFAGMLRQRKFFVNTAGEAHRSPVFARGMVAALDDELSERAKQRPP
jgi:hypothetical protein